MVGDGSFSMLRSELLTADAGARRRSTSACSTTRAVGWHLNNLQVRPGQRRRICTELRYRNPGNRQAFDGEFLNDDYAAIARRLWRGGLHHPHPGTSSEAAIEESLRAFY